MSIEPLITFKAGLCELDDSTKQVKPQPTPGYIYIFNSPEDELMHFCWRPRATSLDEPEVDLIMLPMDGSFTPYQKKPTNGRIFVLKFSSSSQRHLFWLQSKSKSPTGDPSYFSAFDMKLGDIVNSLLQGEDIDVGEAIASSRGNGHPDGDDDETMEDVEGTDHDNEHHRGGSGGAGPDATGGDIREEGEGAREGGADGGRAASNSMDARTIIQNFINSMPGGSGGQQGAQQKLFTTLQDLLTPASTIPWIDSATEDAVDQLLQFLPPNLPSLAQHVDQASPASIPTLSLTMKKDVLKRVLRSPQFTQSLASLTFALRDGGLPSISEALNIPVQNGGYMRRGGVPVGGGDAVEVFLNGVKDATEKKEPKDDDAMDTQ